MKKVLITIGKLDRGGAEMRTLKLISDLNKKNIGILYFIYVVSGERGELTSDFLNEKNVNIIYGRKGFFGLFLFFLTLRKIMPNVLHINASLAGGIYAFVGRLAGLEKIFCHIRTAEHYGSGFIYHTKQKIFTIFLNFFSSKVVGVCDGAKKLSRTPKNKWETVYNGIELTDIDNEIDKEGERPKNFSIICLGRMHKAKNQIFLIEIMRDLVILKPNIDWRLDFYGKENEMIKSNIFSKIQTFHLEEYVRFYGETTNPLEVLSGYNLLLLPSVREGLPGVVLEALSVGCESIISDLDGCKEIAKRIPYVHVMHGYNSYEWANAIIEFYARPRESRFNIRKSLEESVFNNEKHICNMMRLWEIER